MIFIIHTEKLKSINIFCECNHKMVSFIELYDYHINNVNKNLEDDLEIKTYNINEDGVLVS